MEHNFLTASVKEQGYGEEFRTFRAKPQRRKVYVPERKDAVDRIPWK